MSEMKRVFCSSDDSVFSVACGQRCKELNEILAIVNNSVLLPNKWTLAEVQQRSKCYVENYMATEAAETVKAAETLLAAAIRSDGSSGRVSH